MLTQIDVIYENSIQGWTSSTEYSLGQRVNHNWDIYEALSDNVGITPAQTGVLEWGWLGRAGDPGTPVTEEAAMALPILGVTPKDSLLIRKVTGLNPPDIDLFIGDYARDGGTYQGRRVGNRNVVLIVDLNPNPALGETVAGLRDLLYKIFVDPLVDEDHLELVLRSDDGRVRYLYGYVEKFETEIFDIETLVQISLLCPDPYIRDVEETVLVNESGTWVSLPFVYNGTAETGFYVQVNISADTTPALSINANGKVMRFNYGFLKDDIVHLNTTRGARSVTVERGGVFTSLLANMTTQSKWLELHNQSNTLNIYGETSANVVGGVKRLVYRTSYWGV